MTATSPETINWSYQFLKDKGFQILEAPNCRSPVGHCSGTIKDRVKALHDFFQNPKVHGILAYWCGY